MVKKLLFCFLFMSIFHSLISQKIVSTSHIEQIIFENISTQTNTNRDCQFGQLISSFNIPFVISSPGFYCLNATVDFNSGQSPAITIDSDNVVLDLNDQEILGNAQSPGSFGIVVNQRSNVIIKNGVFRNVRANAQSAAISVRPRARPQNEQIAFENITFINNTFGINISDIRNVVFVDIRMFDNAIAFQVTRCNNTIFLDCLANDNINAFLINNCNDVLFRDCIAQDNSQNGFSQIAGQDVTYSNCIANQNLTGFNLVNNGANRVTNSTFNLCLANRNTLFGFNIAGDQNTFKMCEANENSSGFSLLAAGSRGVTNCTFSQCLANKNSSFGFNILGNQHNFNLCQANENATGFTLANNSITIFNNIFTSCLANKNTRFGFDIAGNQHTLKMCQANENTTGFQITGLNHIVLESIAQFNSAFGFSLLGGSATCQIRANTATANGTVGINDVTGIAPLVSTNRVYSNFANNNGPTPPVPGVANFVGVPAANIAVAPVAATAINFTANIAN